MSKVVLCSVHVLAGLQPCSHAQCSWAAGELRQSFFFSQVFLAGRCAET